MEYIGTILSAFAIVLFILTVTKFKGNRPVRLGMLLSLVASAGWRLIQNHLQGTPIGVIDTFAVTFFAIAAATEIVGMVRRKPK